MAQMEASGESVGRRSYQDFQDGPWLRSLFRPLLIALVAGSLLVGPLALLRALTGWPMAYALPLGFLAAAEGTYSTSQLGRPQWRNRRGLLFRLGEIVLLLLLLRVVEWTFASGLPTPQTIAGWIKEPGLFFDDAFVSVALLLFIAWSLAVRMTADFLDLAIQPDEYAAQQTLAWGESRSMFRAGRPVSRLDILLNFVKRWAWGGLLLVITAVAGRVNINVDARGFPGIGLAQAGFSPDVLVGLIVYFLGGLLLISQARLAVLRAGWLNEGVTVAPAVIRRWHATGLVAVLLVAGIASLLPLGSTAGLAGILEWCLAFIFQFLYWLFVLLVFAVVIVVYWLHKLFPLQEQSLPPPRLQMNQPPALPPHIGGLPAWLAGAVFWLLVVVMMGYLALAYLRAQDWWSTGHWAQNWQRLVFWWRARWARFRRVASQARAGLQARLQATRPAVPIIATPRLQRPGKLPPRARVRYFYLSTLRRAAQRGMMRPPAKTPNEFVSDLREQWPEAGVDLEALTEAFDEARYNDRPIATGEARAVEGVWARVLRVLSRSGHGDPGGQTGGASGSPESANKS